jgi:hypothetical protein
MTALAPHWFWMEAAGSAAWIVLQVSDVMIRTPFCAKFFRQNPIRGDLLITRIGIDVERNSTHGSSGDVFIV